MKQRMKLCTTSPIRCDLQGLTVGVAVWAIVLAAPVGPSSAHAEDAISPAAAAILDKYVEVTGGKAAYEKIHNRAIKGRLVWVEMGFEDKLTTYEAAPNKRFTRIESEAMGTMQHGTDGDLVWFLAGNDRSHIEEGEAREAALHEAAFHRAVQWRQLCKKVEHAGQEVIDGKTCHKIVLTPKAGAPATCYYDKSTNLLVRVQRMRLSSCAPPAPVQSDFSDYKWVDGILYPHNIKQTSQMCGETRIIAIVTDSVQHNIELPATTFEPPAQVKAAALAKKVTNGLGINQAGKSEGACGGKQQEQSKTGRGDG